MNRDIPLLSYTPSWCEQQTLLWCLNSYVPHPKHTDRLIFNPLPAVTYQNILDLNVACRAKRTQMYWHVCKFKCPLKKTQPSCPCSRDLNWTSRGLNPCPESKAHYSKTRICSHNFPHKFAMCIGRVEQVYQFILCKCNNYL
jgi:hypothetical protein